MKIAIVCLLSVLAIGACARVVDVDTAELCNADQTGLCPGEAEQVAEDESLDEASSEYPGTSDAINGRCMGRIGGSGLVLFGCAVIVTFGDGHQVALACSIAIRNGQVTARSCTSSAARQTDPDTQPNLIGCGGICTAETGCAPVTKPAICDTWRCANIQANGIGVCSPTPEP